ncbi:MAG: YeeE/YedE thiosulfate transporter family protein [Candidatus Eisenbacteria bacterium]
MELFAARCPWYVAGPLIGLCVVGLLWATNRPLGATGGFIDLVGWLRRPLLPPRWSVAFLAGIVLGGFLSGLAAGSLALDPGFAFFDQRFGTTPGSRLALLAGAGALMGFGVRTAGGCTSGHGICGTSLGSRASWVATAVFMGTAVLAANLLAWWTGSRA